MTGDIDIYREWANDLCECAGENEKYADEFWAMLEDNAGVMGEFRYYRQNGRFCGEYTVSGMTLIDIMIWQMDHFKLDLDKGLYDMQSNPDRMLLKAFETMLLMDKNPEKYLQRFGQDTGTDYPGKY